MESRRSGGVCGRAACAALLLLLLPTTGSSTASAGGATADADDAGSAGAGAGAGAGASDTPHSRQKRLLWVTNDGRLALPPGTALTITPTLSLPFVRYPPNGFLSNMSISLPFTIVFDKLGLTDNENPYGVLPPLLARSMGSTVADYIGALIEHRRHNSGFGDYRTRRSATPPAPPPPLPPRPPQADFHGGERALLYTVVEDLLDNFGMDGKACLLRAICEVHGRAMHQFGVVGEILRLFLTASKSPFANVLDEYVAAERTGQDDGECLRYFQHCPKSIFANSRTALYKGAEEESDESNETEQRMRFTSVTLNGPERKEKDSGGDGGGRGSDSTNPTDAGVEYNVVM